MNPLTENQIRSSFLNISKGDAKRAVLPDLSQITWEERDYLGWQDARRPLLHYVALEVDGELTCLLLRGSSSVTSTKMLCAWCQDVIDGVHAASFVAPLAGEAGRRGNSIGTAICADFGCSRNVRRAPTAVELRTADPALLEYHREQRIAGLRARSTDFVRAVQRR